MLRAAHIAVPTRSREVNPVLLRSCVGASLWPRPFQRSFFGTPGAQRDIKNKIVEVAAPGWFGQSFESHDISVGPRRKLWNQQAFGIKMPTVFLCGAATLHYFLHCHRPQGWGKTGRCAYQCLIAFLEGHVEEHFADLREATWVSSPGSPGLKRIEL